MPPGVTNPDYKPPPGRLGNLTQSELKALETLRQRLQQHQPQDEYDFVFDPVRMNDAMLLRWATILHVQVVMGPHPME